MKRTDIIVPITVAQYSELSQTEKTLVDAARAASTSVFSVWESSEYCATVIGTIISVRFIL